MILTSDKIYIYRIIMSAAVSVTDKKVTSRKTYEKQASVSDNKTVPDKRTRRTRGYPDGCPFDPEEHRVFSAWVWQHEADLFES